MIVKKKNKNLGYLNGNFSPINKLKISPFDRGFLFGDSVYESIPVYYNAPRNLSDHLLRLRKNLDYLCIKLPLSDRDISKIIETLIKKNKFEHQYIYCQITRGNNGLKRSHIFPKFKNKSTVFMIGQPISLLNRDKITGYNAITFPDIRWKYTSIKTTNLLPNVLQINKAILSNAYEGIYIKNDLVIEGTVSNIFLVKEGKILTSEIQESMINGITRKIILEIATNNNISCEIRKINKNEIWAADEICSQIQ